MSNRIDCPYSDTFVLEPHVWKAKVIGCYALLVIAYLLDDAGNVTSYVTPVRTVPLGSAIWMPDGTVATPDREWVDLDSYNEHLKATLQ